MVNIQITKRLPRKLQTNIETIAAGLGNFFYPSKVVINPAYKHPNPIYKTKTCDLIFEGFVTITIGTIGAILKGPSLTLSFGSDQFSSLIHHLIIFYKMHHTPNIITLGF